ncbi:MAG: MATE family efflux transporter [Candidatus Tectomicrobia bacterium]|nr:MATE family efflux transporter [Candidatus Tectomicrobia bacterium]
MRRFQYDYTRGSIGRGLLDLAVPVFLEQIAWNVDTIVEIYWVGRLGESAIAAMSLGFMVTMFVRSGGLGIRVAGQALVAQRVGAGDPEGAAALAGQMLLLHFLYFLPISLLGLWLSEGIMRALTSDPQIVRLGTSYLRASFATVIVTDGIFAFASIFRAAGESFISVWPMAAGSAVTFAAMPVLMQGAGPIPALGLGGAVWGLGAGRLLGCAVMAAIFAGGLSRLRLRPAHLRPAAAPMRRILRLAWPAGSQVLFERSANLVLVGMLSRFGPLALAAWGVGNRVNNMALTPGYSFQGSGRTLVGQNIGARLPGRARRSAWTALLWVALVMAAVAAGVFAWAEEMVRFFGMRGDAVRAGVVCMRVLSLGMAFEAARRTLSGVFEGAAAATPPMIVEAVVRWGVLLPGAWLASVPLGGRETGIWWAVACSQIVGGAALFVWFVAGWQRRVAALARPQAGGVPR